jgi:hypothetical protein
MISSKILSFVAGSLNVLEVLKVLNIPYSGLEVLVHIENNGTDRTVLNDAYESENDILLMQMRVRPALLWTMIVARASVILQQRAWFLPEHKLPGLFAMNQILALQPCRRDSEALG